VKASLDFWDDQDDVYAVYLHRGEKLYASLVPSQDAEVALALWRPETVAVADLAATGPARPPLEQAGPARAARLEGRPDRLALPPGAAHSAVRPPVAYRLSIVRTR
jgi:hypothetical protein